jgi:hypothetical protein
VAWRKVAPCTLYRPLTWRARAGVTVHTHGEGEGDLLGCTATGAQGADGQSECLRARQIRPSRIVHPRQQGGIGKKIKPGTVRRFVIN